MVRSCVRPGVLFLLVLAAAWGPVVAQPAPAKSGATSLFAVLSALDRTIQVEFGKVSPRDAFAELSRAGGIPIEVDPSVRNDIEINAILKGVRLGDALTLLCRNCGLRLLPGNGRLVVAPLPTVTVAAAGVPAPRPAGSVDPNPWQAWKELGGLPLTTAGETGYPRLALAHVLGSGGMLGGASICDNCRGPVMQHWAFCPRCGRQRLPALPQGHFCTACGRPHGVAGMAPVPTAPAVTPPPAVVVPTAVEPRK